MSARLAAQFQYTLNGDTLDDLNEWAPKLLTASEKNSRHGGCERRPAKPWIADPARDRPATRFTARCHISAIDNSLYDAFGQRQVSRMYRELNQYHVVMEVRPNTRRDREHCDILRDRNHRSAASAAESPYYETSKLALSVNHRVYFIGDISFNLVPDVAGCCRPQIERARAK